MHSLQNIIDSIPKQSYICIYIYRKQILAIEYRICAQQCRFRRSNRTKHQSYMSFMQKLIHRPHFRIAIFRSPFHRHSQGLTRFAMSNRSTSAPSRSGYAHAFATRKYIQGEMKKRFHGATQSISLFLSLSSFFSLAFSTSSIGFRTVSHASSRTHVASFISFTSETGLSIRNFYFAMPSGCRSVL